MQIWQATRCLPDFADFLYYEFTELLKQGLTVRRCKNCGQYFVLKSHHHTYYCDREQENGRTCKQIGGKREYQNRLAADPILQEYGRIYKLRHAQMERDEQKERPADTISRAKKEFLKWSKQAQTMRKSYLSGKISFMDAAASAHSITSTALRVNSVSVWLSSK